MPIYELWYQATSNKAAATVFMACMMVTFFFIVMSAMQSTSRLIWAFGRDRGFIFWRQFATMNSHFEVPIYGLLLNSVGVLILGCIYLGSSAAFNAIINSCIMLQIVSFAIPCVLLVLRKRHTKILPDARAFKVHSLVGWVANAVVIVFAIVEVVFFSFPAALPVSGSSMSE